MVEHWHEESNIDWVVGRRPLTSRYEPKRSESRWVCCAVGWLFTRILEACGGPHSHALYLFQHDGDLFDTNLKPKGGVSQKLSPAGF